MIDEKLKDDEDLLREYQGKWQELWFLINGKTILDNELYDTEESAREHINHIMNNYPKENDYDFGNGSRYTSKEISHAIPIPVSD